MKLDRNLEENLGHGKYALLMIRRLEDLRCGTFGDLPKSVKDALDLLIYEQLIDFGEVNTESEFFVVRLKDRYARAALDAYAAAAFEIDSEWSREVKELAKRSGLANQWCKDPD